MWRGVWELGKRGGGGGHPFITATLLSKCARSKSVCVSVCVCLESLLCCRFSGALVGIQELGGATVGKLKQGEGNYVVDHVNIVLVIIE